VLGVVGGRGVKCRKCTSSGSGGSRTSRRGFASAGDSRRSGTTRH